MSSYLFLVVVIQVSSIFLIFIILQIYTKFEKLYNKFVGLMVLIYSYFFILLFL